MLHPDLMIVRLTVLSMGLLIWLFTPISVWDRIVRGPFRRLRRAIPQWHRQTAFRLSRLVLDPAREVLPQVLPGRPAPSMDLPNSVIRWCAAFLVWMPVRMLFWLSVPVALSLANEFSHSDNPRPLPPPSSADPLSSLFAGFWDGVRWMVAPFVVLLGDIDSLQDLREQAPGWLGLLREHPGVALDHLAGPAFLICLIVGSTAFSRTAAFFGRDGQRRQRRRSLGDERLAEVRFRPVGILLSAATQAARAYLETEAATSLLDAPRIKVHRVERVIRNAWRTRNGRPRRHQRRELKLHAAKVVMALRLAEGQQDIEPGPALKEMTRILVTVAERYAEGKVGELLDHDDHALVGIDPAPDYEPLRIAGVFAAGVVGAILASLLKFPELAQTLLAAGSAIVMLFILFKRAARPMLEAFGSFFGGS